MVNMALQSKNLHFLEFTHVCCQGKCKKSTVKLLKMQEHTIISVHLLNGEHWKTCVFLNSLEFGVSESERKQENVGIHYSFSTLLLFPVDRDTHEIFLLPSE